MIAVADYSIEEVFTWLDAGMRSVAIPGGKANLSSARLRLFRAKGITCVECGLEASFFRLEKVREVETPHFNLYGVREGKLVLFTKDHIHPKSKGGANSLENFQTMCQPCNGKKGSTVRGDALLKPQQLES